MIGGLILAAGGSSRFEGRPKLLADLGGRPLLEHSIAAACAVRELDRIIVVLGAYADEISAAVRFNRAERVICNEWRTGMSASLRCGVAALPDTERIIVTLGDSPTVTPAVVRRFLYAADGARAVYKGRPGHPVVLGPRQRRLVESLSGDTGARGVLDGGPKIECADLASGRDVDTTDELEAMRRELRTGLSQP